MYGSPSQKDARLKILKTNKILSYLIQLFLQMFYLCAKMPITASPPVGDTVIQPPIYTVRLLWYEFAFFAGNQETNALSLL
jgi:hypothetical protein